MADDTEARRKCASFLEDMRRPATPEQRAASRAQAAQLATRMAARDAADFRLIQDARARLDYRTAAETKDRVASRHRAGGRGYE